MNSLFKIFLAVFAGFGTGFAASIPLGPSGIESVKRSITSGFNEGFKVSVGAVLADLTYLIIINLGLSKLLTANPKTESLFWVLSGIILIVFSFITNKKTSDDSILTNSKLGGVMSGFIITFINPMTPSLWLVLSGTIISIWRSNGHFYYITAITFMIIGSISWFALLNYFSCKGIKLFKSNKSKYADRLLKYVLTVLGLAFVFYGLYKFIF